MVCSHFRTIIFTLTVILAIDSVFSYQCSSDHPTTGIEKCDHGVCDTCKASCTGYLGWDATCKIQGGIVTETCQCRKSNPYHCNQDQPKTGEEKCDTICETCKKSCIGYLGWDAVCDISGGIVTETCNCHKNSKLMANVLTKLVQAPPKKL